MPVSYLKVLVVLSSILLLSSCVVGPDYKRPPTKIPPKFKEAPKGWKYAQPNDSYDRGQWWRMFHDCYLNSLEAKLNISNQTIATAAAQYRQAYALVDEARASYYPLVTTSASLIRQKQVSSGANASVAAASSGTSATSGTTTTTSTTSLGGSAGITTNHSLLLNASWEPDLWGSIRRNVEAAASFAQSSAAALALARLSAQASLAQFYFELRGLDKDQQLLDDTVTSNRKILQITRNQYNSGTVTRADIASAEGQLEAAKAAAINNGILRGQYEHAIAVLIGEPPSTFSIPPKPLHANPPEVPLEIPSVLLERRPDVAQAERLMSQANAQIGVAIAAYYPTLTISGALSVQHQGFNKWFSYPLMNWAIGPQLAETIFDGGLRNATVCAARANYDATVASYREIVLAAFQDVEDNLVSVRLLKAQSKELDRAAANADLALKLNINEYKAGTVPYSTVLTAQLTAYTAEKNAADVKYLLMTSTVGVIKALGGGWDQSYIKKSGGCINFTL